jgi:Transglycosylase SLT domain
VKRSVRRRHRPRPFPLRDNPRRVLEQGLRIAHMNRRPCRSLLDAPWLAPVIYIGILLALFFAPSHVANFLSASNEGPHLSTAPPLERDALPVTVYIRAAATRYGVPENLVTAVIAVESEFNPRAVSRKGATGLMQLMPATAATFGVRDRLDAPQNIDGGVRHLRALMDRFSNNLPLVLAAYNAGERPIAVYGGIPPYPETRHFVVRVLHRLGDRRAVEKVLEQSAARGRRGQGHRTPVFTTSSHETRALPADTRDTPDRLKRSNVRATSQHVAGAQTGNSTGKSAGEAKSLLPAPAPPPGVSPGAVGTEGRIVIQAP